MNQFEQKSNYDNVFLRNITLGVMSEFYRKIRWINTWNDKQKLITVPVYYSSVGNERFMLDAFVDDIIGTRPELNIDPVPRALFNISDFLVKKSEISNPNVNMAFYKEENGILKKKLAKFQVLPIKVDYQIEIKIASEIDLMKCQQSILDWFYNYKYFYYTYDSWRIDATLFMPDNVTAEMNREIQGLSGNKDTAKTIKFNVEVHTFYPIPLKEQTPIIATSCNKVLMKGSVYNMGIVNEKKVYIGGNINGKK